MAKFRVGDRVRISMDCELELSRVDWHRLGGTEAIHEVEELTPAEVDEIEDHHSVSLKNVPFIFSEWDIDLISRPSDTPEPVDMDGFSKNYPFENLP